MADMSQLDYALQMRDVIASLVEEKIQELRPQSKYAVVDSVDAAHFKANVIFNGDTLPVTVSTNHFIFVKPGDVVRVGRIKSDSFIEDIVNWNGILGDRVGLSLSRENLLRNGNFSINQRGYVSGAYINGFCFDGWRGAYNIDTKLTFTASPQGQMVTMGFRSPSTYGLIDQGIPRSNIVPGYHTMSWSGTARGRFGNRSAVASIPLANSPLTVYLDGTEDVFAQMLVDASMGGTATLGNVKLERGPIATPYAKPSFESEMAACRLFCQKMVTGASQPVSVTQAYAANHSHGMMQFPSPMRSAPTITVSNNSHFQLHKADGNSAGISVFLLQVITPHSLRFDIETTSSVLVAGNASLLVSNNAAASILLEAEVT